MALFFAFKSVLVILAAFLAYRYLYPTPAVKSPVITTNLGSVQGKLATATSRNGLPYYEYLGIPYAAPPVGENRYKPPQMPESWKDVRDTSTWKPQCIQNPAYFGPLAGEEDCLYLNVFVPKQTIDAVERNTGAKPLPVMVWIHGGHFSEGTPQMYQPAYWMDENVILVSITYRMNSFGFLNTGDGTVRGNMGLKDQVMALIWVQENIAAFGGNPLLVTIFGESAGGASVHYHLISPQSQGLFQKVIAISGTALNSWALTRNPAEQSKRFARLLNCPTESTTEMVECLRTLPAVDIARVHEEAKDPLREQHAMYLPSLEAIDDEQTFIATHPRKLAEAGQMGKGIPLLIGVNSEEGSLFWKIPHRCPKASKKLCDRKFWESKIFDLLFLPNDDPAKSTKAARAVREHYFGADGDICDHKRFRKQFFNLHGQPTFFNGFDSAARLHARHSPTYAYYFNHIGAGSYIDIMDITQTWPWPFNALELEFIYLYFKASFMTWIGYDLELTGAAHADDLHYMFAGLPLPERDVEMSRAIVKMFAQFARDESRAKFMGQKLVKVPESVAKNASEPLPVLEISMKPKYIPFPHAADVQFWNSLGIIQ